MKIFINPGHTPQSEIDAGIDWDCGARGFGLQENLVAWSIGSMVENFLSDAGYDTKLFQSGDLAEIVDVSNYWGADIFVSIHCNALNGQVCGTTSIYYEFSDEGAKLAQAIQNQIVSRLDIVDRGIANKIGNGYDSYVCKHTHCPACLVETAFIDNPADNLLLADNQEDFARAIACGITDYIGG